MEARMKERRGNSKGIPAATTAAAAAKRPKRKKVDASHFGGFFTGLHIGTKTAAVCALLSVSSVVLILIALHPRDGGSESSSRPRAVTPLPVPRIMDLPQFQGEHNERLFWGTYRPHIYLGIRSRTPKSLLAGLMWVGIKDGYYAIRHTCEDSDGLRRYGWVRHDGVSYGRQEILDQNLKITTSFSKSWDEGSGYGGDWSVRVNVENDSEDNTQADREASLFFYITDEEGGSMSLWPRQIKAGPFAAGYRQDIGGWEIHMRGTEGAAVHYAGFQSPYMHNLTQLVQRSLKVQYDDLKGRRLRLPDASEKSSNVAVFQITGRTPLQLDVTFIAGVGRNNFPVQTRVENLSGARLDKKLAAQEEMFEKRFEDTFNLEEEELSSFGSTDAVDVGKAALSNLLGGISYFFGESLIAVPPKDQDSYDEHHWTYWPAALYSAVPCRSFFPRGFLWDEGFHQIIVSKWDRNLTYDIVGHWLDLLNVDGWIPREQILGAEAKARVPDEFVLQHTDNGNPPTLFLPLHDIALAALKAEANGQLQNIEKAFLEKIFPRLEAWFEWFNTTQAGGSLGAYYWHGRDANTDKELNAKSFSSGLDDYPRASHPTADERHVDLRCWMALASKSMVLIAKVIGAPHQKYEVTAQLLSDFDVLNKLHYDHTKGRYYDYGNHTEKVKLEWDNVVDHRTGYMQRVLRRVVFGRPKLQFVPHFGYVNLFPFMMKLIPVDSPILGKQLELLRNEKLLWTSYGLRSLATTSSIYNKHNTQHDPPYWRGSVWINFNYLVLSSLHYYSQEAGPYKDTAASMYRELRGNLIRNIVRRYNETGYLFEQYDNTKQGSGRGARPFTGWTSLILLVMAEQYPR